MVSFSHKARAALADVTQPSHVGAEALKSDLRNEPGHTEVTETPAFTMRRHYHPHAHAAVPSDLGALLCAVTASHT